VLFRAGCRPRAEQDGRGEHRRVGLQLVCQPLPERLHAYASITQATTWVTSGAGGSDRVVWISCSTGMTRPPGRGRESRVAHPAAQVQHPHARLDARRGEDHPRGRAERPALHLKARQLVTAGELVARVAIDRCAVSDRAMPALTSLEQRSLHGPVLPHLSGHPHANQISRPDTWCLLSRPRRSERRAGPFWPANQERHSVPGPASLPCYPTKPVPLCSVPAWLTPVPGTWLSRRGDLWSPGVRPGKLSAEHVLADLAGGGQGEDAGE
jgi:hypothetical protein